jgi:hypothetical protein
MQKTQAAVHQHQICSLMVSKTQELLKRLELAFNPSHSSVSDIPHKRLNCRKILRQMDDDKMSDILTLHVTTISRQTANVTKLKAATFFFRIVTEN